MTNDQLTIDEIVAILKAHLVEGEPISLELMQRLEEMRRSR